MIGENGTPDTPDWTPCPGNRCGNDDCTPDTHCGPCATRATVGAREIDYPVAYYGD